MLHTEDVLLFIWIILSTMGQDGGNVPWERWEVAITPSVSIVSVT